MKVRMSRRGGFAGILAKPVEVDTEELPAAEARTLRELVESAALFDQPAKLPPPARREDRFQYTIHVESEGRQHTVEATEGAIPAPLQALVDYLERVEKERRRAARAGDDRREPPRIGRSTSDDVR